MGRSAVQKHLAETEEQIATGQHQVASRGLFGQKASKGLFSLFGCLRHAFKKAGRAFYQPRATGAIDFPPPGLRKTPSSLHDERIIGRVKSFTHAS
jgi:hypothetical protein